MLAQVYAMSSSPAYYGHGGNSDGRQEYRATWKAFFDGRERARLEHKAELEKQRRALDEIRTHAGGIAVLCPVSADAAAAGRRGADREQGPARKRLAASWARGSKTPLPCASP